MAHAFTNQLIHESSPYLLQHAHNPVNWYPWGEKALALSRDQDKPILVSIGYAACHWCHVMEKESFEDEDTAAYMNENFINIKIDREERPDLDHIYMEAVQAIAGNGGWPLNVFLTTDAKPFYGGTYFPPQKAFNRASWKDVLSYMVDAWTNRRGEVESQAETLLNHINSSGNFIKVKLQPPGEDFFTAGKCRAMAEALMKSADTRYGGFGNAPKFPQTFSLKFLLAYHHFYGDESALKHAEFSLQQLVNGGIYDQLAGGMARYSTDVQWLAPHFEKMLYDNALLVGVLADAYQLTKNNFYERAIRRTLGFFVDEMKHPEGGFYAALDADSEGEEGKYYVWQKAEIDELLGDDAAVFCEWFGVTESGNWEHTNILHVTRNEEEFAAQKEISRESLQDVLNRCVQRLLSARKKRTPPATDDKIILGWNALLLTAFCKASAALADESYQSEAVLLFEFLEKKFTHNGKVTFHTYKNGIAKHPAYLDDNAYLIQAAISLQELTGDSQYLLKVQGMLIDVIEDFADSETGFFFYTGKHQKDVITRKVELYDSAVPSGNSVMAENLAYLAIIFDKPEWAERSRQMLASLADILNRYPGSFGLWANLFLRQAVGAIEIAVTGNGSIALGREILAQYLPGKVFQMAQQPADLPLLKDKIYGNDPLIYVCKNYACAAPVKDLQQFQLQIKNGWNNS